ncbi:ion transporter [Oceanobacillus picturae]|uniref:Ion transporter n=1 Tax=Oceanobacillus picturae TaxID=171693 RepID=A0A0U9H5Q1_9BACI|nr:potassium channel family protein [Oceanobacillus picturae]GAQ17982.1 ion transporter [Oceanobacillus picturae]
MKIKKESKTKIYLAYEIILVIIAFISVIFIWSGNKVVLYLDKVIWLIFFLDVVIRFIVNKHKWRFVKNNPFDIIAAIPLDAIFHTARIARLFKVFRLFAITKSHANPIFSIVKTNGLDRVLSAAGIMIFLSSILITWLEPNIHNFSDGVWWSIVTTTTVGYGDISPNTAIGRIIAIFLMVIGVGLIGMITGSITTFFIKGNNQKNPQLEFIKGRLDHFEELNDDEINELINMLYRLKSVNERRGIR